MSKTMIMTGLPGAGSTTLISPTGRAARTMAVILVEMEMSASDALLRSAGMRERTRDQATRRKAQEDEASQREAREIGWGRDQLERDIAAAGDPVRLVSVKNFYGKWTFKLVQWLAHGVGAEIGHDFTYNRMVYNEDHDEQKLRRAVTARFAKLLVRQRELAERMGKPRIMTPDEVDLGKLSIEMPVAAALKRAFGEDAGKVLREAIATNRGAVQSFTGSRRYKALENAGMSGLELEFGRDTVRGIFSAGHGEKTIRWSKGGLSIFGVDIPETMLEAMPGRRIGEIIEHPLIDAGMRVTAATRCRKNGRDGVALTVRDMTSPVPAEW